MVPSFVGRDEEVRTLVNKLDLDLIKVKLMDSEDGAGWGSQKVLDVESQYRKFLFLNYKYPDRAIVPSKDVDEFWHYHILDTRKYADDCQSLFGYFLHHFPYFGMGGEEDARNLREAFLATNELFNQIFGNSLERSSSDVKGVAALCNSCSHCKGYKPFPEGRFKEPN